MKIIRIFVLVMLVFMLYACQEDQPSIETPVESPIPSEPIVLNR